ncbi:ammonium transmembrane transporter [Balamuthia mandrillaris]
MVGGACGLMGALIIGPRLGRFQKGKLFSGKIHGHNIAYSALGTFILWTGWYGFNPGSTLLATGVSHIAARCAVTTTISAGTASMCTLVIGVCWSLWVEKEFVIDISLSLNGILAGLVGITSSCAVVQPWAALIIGVVSAFVYFFSAKLLELLKIDDPVDAAPIHFFCGMWGVLAVGFFAWEGFVEETYRPTNDYGVFVGSDSGRQLGVQIVGTIAIAAWSLSLSGALFLALRILGMLRVPASVEISGLDEDHHGGSGYDMKGATGSVIQRTTGFTSNSVLEEKVMKKLDRFWSSKKDEDEGVEMQQTRRKGGAKQQKDEEGSNSLSDEENPRRAIEERGSMIHRGQI